MPIIPSAIKKLRQARKKTEVNRKKKRGIKGLIETFKATTTLKNLSAAYSGLDKSAKTGVIHKNKAARLKSRLAKRLASKK